MMTEAERLELEAQLLDWSGATARPWSYAASHATLQIELRQGSRRAFLWCVACEELSIRRFWTDARFTLTETQGDGGRAPYRLADFANGFAVRCGNARIEDLSEDESPVP